METVLGLSVTPDGVGWVVCAGSHAGAEVLDHDVVDVADGPTAGISMHLGAVRGAQAIAAASGLHLTAIGIAWTADCTATASLVLRALPGLGFDQIVPLGLVDADDDELMLARAAARAVMSGAAAIAVSSPLRQPAAAVPTRRHRWLAPTRAAAVLIAGVCALFVVGPEFGGQPGSPAPEREAVSDPSAAVAVQLVAGHPAPTPIRSYAVPTAVSEAVAVTAPQPSAVAEPTVQQAPVQHVAAISPAIEPTPLPAMPQPDPAQLALGPLLGGLP